jgi:hypothetical protein
VSPTQVDDPLSPAAFLAAVRRCATQRHHAVRALASRALTPLVPAEAVRPTYSDQKVANREIRVWHLVIKNGY